MWKKRKKVILASLGSLLIHVVVVFVVAFLFSLAPPAAPADSEEPPKPLEVQITHVPETTPPPLAAPTPHRQFIDLDASDLATATTPSPDAKFEGDRNTAARSDLPPSGDQDAPSQKGKAAPLFAFESHPYAPDRSAAAAAAPTPVPETEPPRPQPDRNAPRPQSTPPPEPAATPAPTPKADEFAMDDPTPTPGVDFDPSVRAPADTPPIAHAPTPPPPRKPGGGALDEQKTQINGKVANSGASSLAMLATPQGAYKKAVTDAIKTRWYAYINARLDTASYGTVTVHFFIERSGRVISPHVVANSGNEALASASMQAIMEAHIPPIPDDVASGIKDEVMPLDFDFTLY